jgi:hypothetical protein
MLYINSCNISVELGDGTARLHPILGDLGCIPAHIKCMKLFQCVDIIYLLTNQSDRCYLQYIVTQFQWGPLCSVPGPNISVKGVKNAIRETCTLNSISTDQYKVYLILGAPLGYLSDAVTTLFYIFL